MEPFLLALVITFFVRNVAQDAAFALRGKDPPSARRQAQRATARGKAASKVTSRSRPSRQPLTGRREGRRYVANAWHDAWETAAEHRERRRVKRGEKRQAKWDARDEARRRDGTDLDQWFDDTPRDNAPSPAGQPDRMPDGAAPTPAPQQGEETPETDSQKRLEWIADHRPWGAPTPSADAAEDRWKWPTLESLPRDPDAEAGEDADADDSEEEEVPEVVDVCRWPTFDASPDDPFLGNICGRPLAAGEAYCGQHAQEAAWVERAHAPYPYPPSQEPDSADDMTDDMDGSGITSREKGPQQTVSSPNSEVLGPQSAMRFCTDMADSLEQNHTLTENAVASLEARDVTSQAVASFRQAMESLQACVSSFREAAEDMESQVPIQEHYQNNPGAGNKEFMLAE